MECKAAGLVQSPAVWSPVPAEPWGFFPAVEPRNGVWDRGRAHQWMEDCVLVSRLVVTTGSLVSRYLGFYPHGLLADDQ